LYDGKIQTVNSMKYPTREIKHNLHIEFKYHYLRHTYGTFMAEMWKLYQELGSYTKVAKKLNRNPATVSRHVHEYEAAVNTAIVILNAK